MRILKLLCRVGIHSWVTTPATYVNELQRAIALPKTQGSRKCRRCGACQIEDIHCLGLNPPKYVSTWRNAPVSAPRRNEPKYLLQPGFINRRFVSAATLAELYGVKMSDCLIQVSMPPQSKGRNPEYFDNLIHLYPRLDGNYTLPICDKHDLYKTGDADAPDCIKDRNGEVALAMCRKCKRAESELSVRVVNSIDPHSVLSAGIKSHIGAAMVAERLNRNKPMSHRSCCTDCGEDMVGDGYTVVMRCPNADDEDFQSRAPDDGPFYCGYYDSVTDRNKRPEPPEPPPPRTSKTWF